MEEAADDLDPSVGFLYKTMLERDPKKRRVKPVQPHLLQLDFGGFEDSSDDSDFEFKADKKVHGSGDEDSEDDDDDEEGVDKSSDEESDDDSDEESESDDNTKGENEESADSVPMEMDVFSMDDSNSLLVGDYSFADSKTLNKAPSEETGTSSIGSSKRMKIVICCVCLGDASEDDDEIVDCDGCGVSVHEGCYGITDTQSVASTISSASTEPWFCDACKAGITPSCELCPNSGGIYKETDAGKWVHIVCALYIPGVAFADVDKLSPVTLFEMPYSKWGAKECSLCDDDHFSRTGVCVGCDAGMCRTYFHVTCAQREGLLSEASPDEEIADPFFAYCKQHADKMTARSKKRNYLAIQSRRKEKEMEIEDEKEKRRVQRKLTRHRQKYQIGRAKRPPSWVPTEKMPRMLFSSPSATRKLLKKAELLGITAQAHSGANDIRKKWHVPPALTVDFIGYFLDRNERMKGMKKRLRDLLSLREKLQEQERLLRLKYDRLSEDVAELRDTGQKLFQDVENTWKTLNSCCAKSIKLPEILKPKKPAKTPTTAKKDVPKSSIIGVIHQCSLCHKSTDQHLLVRCDICHLYYHLGCLDPPLTRMPKKTKLMGWQCSECTSSGSDASDEPEVDTNAPRRLREKIKEPLKFSPSLSEITRGLAKRGRAKKKRKPSTIPIKMQDGKNEQKGVNSLNTLPNPASIINTSPGNRTPKKKKASVAGKMATKNVMEAQMILECCVCLKAGDMTNTIRCDNCTLGYHYQCLDPPQSKSPKYRGYAWFCSACQQDSEDETEESYTIDGRSVRPSPLRRPVTSQENSACKNGKAAMMNDVSINNAMSPLEVTVMESVDDSPAAIQMLQENSPIHSENRMQTTNKVAQTNEEVEKASTNPTSSSSSSSSSTNSTSSSNGNVKEQILLSPIRVKIPIILGKSPAADQKSPSEDGDSLEPANKRVREASPDY